MNAQPCDLTTSPYTPTSSGLKHQLNRLHGAVSVLVIGGTLCTSNTSSAQPNQLWEPPYIHEDRPTSSGEVWLERTPQEVKPYTEDTSQALAQLRLLSGLTWEQLGQLFKVTRRSVHFWASGKPLNAENEQHLRRTLDILRAADRGEARANRSALLEVQAGRSALDLLTEQRFEEARARLGSGQGRKQLILGELSDQAKAARAPLRPEELIEARHERVHQDTGHARAARTVRNSQRGTT